MTQGPDWDAFDQSPTTTDRRQAAERAVIGAARDIYRRYEASSGGRDAVLIALAESGLEHALAVLDAVGTPDEVK